ncbi:hypothetical protein B1R32_109122 [Abditibacterium utsteinense]|uniref:DUF5666 domain-containing protein n=1 Tax=Abditibacterium utsteinense TaxID=1960156 RepID=A0A2S8SSJ0_9BACT|nr:hypothetical protein [Abditibacterium utsteinense]PQV63782.1 hypothetical protein B1R32_109122 [Abditibacterium utsteinense]
MKLSLLKTLSLGVAAGAMSLCSTANAQTTMDNGTTGTMDSSTMSTGMNSSSAMMTPMPVSGTVLRYYVDRSGFVTAMDVQTADGIRMVRFAPSMAQNLTSMYPVGSTASVYVTSSMMGNMTRYDLAGMGTEMPTPTSMMSPMMVSDVDMLRAEPYTTIGAKPTRYMGTLSGYIADPMSGEVLALILDDKTQIRVPRENRLVQASTAPNGITPLMRGAQVVAYGLPEAPRYGSVSPYETRVIGTGIAVNGRALGPLGFGKMAMTKNSSLLGFNLFGGADMTPEETSAMGMGYRPYMAPGSTAGTMAPNGMDGTMAPNGTDGTMVPGTMDSTTTPATTTPGM